MTDIFTPTGGNGHTRPKFLPKNQMLGTTKIAMMTLMKGSVEDLGVVNHANREPVGIVPLFENSLNVTYGAIYLPYPGDEYKLLTAQVLDSVHNKDDDKFRTLKVAMGTAANTSTHPAMTRAVHNITLFGIQSKHTVRQVKFSIALTDTNAYLLVFVNGKEGNGERDTFHAFYSFVYDLKLKTFVNGETNETPIHSLGILGSPTVNKYLPSTNPGPSFSPFWNKETREWIFIVHHPVYSQTGSIFSCSPDTAERTTHVTGNLGNLKACVTADYRAFNRDGGLSSQGMGTRKAYPYNMLDTPGGVGGLGNFSRSGWSTITVVTSDYNYFISLDEDDDTVTDGVSHELLYGACDYNEEVKFRETMANLHGL